MWWQQNGNVRQNEIRYWAPEVVFGDSLYLRSRTLRVVGTRLDEAADGLEPVLVVERAATR